MDEHKGKVETNFAMIPNELQTKVKWNYQGLLAFIASLAREKGYSYNSNKYFFDHMRGLTQDTLKTGLNNLEDNGFIKRYFKIFKGSEGSSRAKRRIVLTKATFEIYHANNSSMHEPIKKPPGWLDTQEYTNTTRVKHQKKHKKSSSDATSEPQASERANLVESNGAKSASQAKLANSSVNDAKTVENSPNKIKSSNNGLNVNQASSTDKTRATCYRKFLNKHFGEYFKENNGDTDIIENKMKSDFNEQWNDPEKKKRLLSY